MVRTIFITITLLMPASLMAQHHGPETKSSGVSYKIILQQLLPDTELENREVKMLVVDFPPNSESAAHRHPCPTFGYMLEGEIESVFEGKTYTYKQGDSFYEAANGLHLAARNKHPSKGAKLLVFFIAEKDKPTTVPEN